MVGCKDKRKSKQVRISEEIMLLELISYAGTAFGFLFLTLSIASGLYYISELVEEHTEPTRRFLTRAIYSIILVLISLMLLDGFPFKLTLFSIACYIVYYQNLKSFPYISLTLSLIHI